MTFEFPFFAMGVAMLSTRAVIMRTPPTLPPLQFDGDENTEQQPAVQTVASGPANTLEETQELRSRFARLREQVSMSVSEWLQRFKTAKMVEAPGAVQVVAPQPNAEAITQEAVPVVNAVSPSQTTDPLAPFLSIAEPTADEPKDEHDPIVSTKQQREAEVGALYEIEEEDLPQDERDLGGQWAADLLKREVPPSDRLLLAARLIALRRSTESIVRAISEDVTIRVALFRLVAEQLPVGPEIYSAIASTCADTDLAIDHDGSIIPDSSHPAVDIAGALADAGRRDELAAMVVDGRKLSQVLFGFLIQGSETITKLTEAEQQTILAPLGDDDRSALKATAEAAESALQPASVATGAPEAALT